MIDGKYDPHPNDTPPSPALVALSEAERWEVLGVTVPAHGVTIDSMSAAHINILFDAPRVFIEESAYRALVEENQGLKVERDRWWQAAIERADKLILLQAERDQHKRRVKELERQIDLLENDILEEGERD